MSQESGKIKSFTDLVAWQEAHKLVLMIYPLLKSFPKDELFGLTLQMKRAVISVTSNIAEGFSRGSYKEKVYFYYISLGSATEIQNQLLAARDLHYCTQLAFIKAADQSVIVNKLLNGLIKSSKSMTRDS